jgi:hypothetical protein
VMALCYERPNLRIHLSNTYPRGCIVVMDEQERMLTTAWPEDVDTAPMLEALLPEPDGQDSDLPPMLTKALANAGIDPTFADCVGALIERGWTYALELEYEDDNAFHRVTVSAGHGSAWGVVASAICADHAEALASALVMAIRIEGNRNR